MTEYAPVVVVACATAAVIVTLITPWLDGFAQLARTLGG